MSFPETVSENLCRNSLVVQTHSFISCLVGWSVESCRLRSQMWRSWAGVVTHGLRLCGRSYSKMTLDVAYNREVNIQFSGNISGGHSCSQHANCTLPQNLRHLWHCFA
jgi:hypothetical protein